MTRIPMVHKSVPLCFSRRIPGTQLSAKTHNLLYPNHIRTWASSQSQEHAGAYSIVYTVGTTKLTARMSHYMDRCADVGEPEQVDASGAQFTTVVPGTRYMLPGT